MIKNRSGISKNALKIKCKKRERSRGRNRVGGLLLQPRSLYIAQIHGLGPFIPHDSPCSGCFCNNFLNVAPCKHVCCSVIQLFFFSQSHEPFHVINITAKISELCFEEIIQGVKISKPIQRTGKERRDGSDQALQTTHCRQRRTQAPKPPTFHSPRPTQPRACAVLAGLWQCRMKMLSATHQRCGLGQASSSSQPQFPSPPSGDDTLVELLQGPKRYHFVQLLVVWQNLKNGIRYHIPSWLRSQSQTYERHHHSNSTVLRLITQKTKLKYNFRYYPSVFQTLE